MVMRLLLLRAMFVIACAVSGTATASETTVGGPAHVRYLTEDYAPSNYLENGHLKGIAVDLLKAIWKRMDVPAQPIEVINWARGFHLAETVPNTMLFAMTRTEEREQKFHWVGPIYRGSYVLVRKAGNPIRITSVQDASAYRIGVLRQDLGHRLMLDAGLPDAKLEKVSHVQQLVKMLDADRIDLVCIYADTLKEYSKAQGFSMAKYSFSHVVKENVMYFALNKDTAPALVAEFQAALSALEPERRKIVLQYGGTP